MNTLHYIQHLHTYINTVNSPGEMYLCFSKITIIQELKYDLRVIIGVQYVTNGLAICQLLVSVMHCENTCFQLTVSR